MGITEEQRHTVRNLNREINLFESRNNLPICSSRPLKLGFDISSVCNVKCIFCVAESSRLRKSDPAAFRPASWMDNFEPLLPFIDLGIFSSFEAILNPEFDQAVLKLRKFFTPFELFSNGHGVGPELAEFCLRNGMNSLFCSFHGAKEETVEGIMRGLSFDRTVQNLMRLKVMAQRYNPAFRLTMVFCAMRRNIEELLDYVDLAHRLGAAAIQVNYLLVVKEDTGLDEESMYFHQDLYDVCVLKAKQKAMRYGIELRHQPTFHDYQEANGFNPCYRPWEHLIVNQKGDVSICCGGSGSLGNIFEKDFFATWNSEAFQSVRSKVNSDSPPLACQKCTRGRENPKDIRNHLTYLKRMDNGAMQKRMRELQRLKTGGSLPIHCPLETMPDCRC